MPSKRGMPNREFRLALGRLGWNYGRAAYELNLSRRAIEDYCGSRRAVHPSAAVIVRRALAELEAKEKPSV